MAVWQSCSGGRIPPSAIRAGYEADGRPLYVGRVRMQDGSMTPGKAGCHLPGAHIPWGSKENVEQNYEILVQPVDAVGHYEWQRFSGGNVPHNAMSTDRGMYVARCYHEGSLVPGKVHTDHGCAYIPYGGDEKSCSDYEVLCRVK
ncbi:natterin-4-like [Mya arenaria]|uniref:natterin-4-like n=1 Tax=Mya arenaria TaxID=6604 RepID=UPI0022E13CDB|nr:natterin-4-like [Mya arenaria]